MLDKIFSVTEGRSVPMINNRYSIFRLTLLIILSSFFLYSNSQAADFQHYYPIPATPAIASGSKAVSVEVPQLDLDKIQVSEGKVQQGYMISTATVDDIIKHAGQDYPATEFTLFKREIDLLRLQALSSTTTFNVELPSQSQPTDNHLRQSDLYQELIFHAALTGNRTFLFNNQGATPADEQLLNATLVEIDQLLGSDSYQSSVDGLLDWNRNFVLSSAEQGDKTIWRFTPTIPVEDSISEMIVSREPAQLKIGETLLTFPNSKIIDVENTSSAAGLWIVQSGESETSSCRQHHVGEQCIEYFSNSNATGKSRLAIQSKAKNLTNISKRTNLLSRNWDLAGAGYGAGINAFSLRVTETHELATGKYEFVVTADDAVKLWIDGKLIIDAWSDNTQKSRSLSADITLEKGKHTIQLEYADYEDVAAVKLSIKKISCEDERCSQIQESNDRVDQDSEDADKSEENKTEEEKEAKKRDEAVIKNTCVLIPDNAFCTEFYAGIALEGEPIHKRIDPSINFYWKGESPQKGIVPKDKFSTRWQGYFEFEESEYRFISSTDDGIRIWVDGDEIISSWKNQGTTEYFADIKLSKGKHLIKVEYYEKYGWATAKLRWEKKADCSGIPENKFCASYFNQDKAFEGEPNRTYLTDKINHNVAKRKGPLHGIRDYKYSVRWLGQFDFEQDGYYQFNSDTDDGLRIWVDDLLVTDTWKKPWPFKGKDQRVVKINAGQHIIKVEYYQAWNEAKAIVNWQYLKECSAEIKDAFCMEIYQSRKLGELEGVQALPRYLKKVDHIDFDWQNTPPEDLIRKDNYSMRWTGKHKFDAGNYRFTTSTDDGVRLYIDGKLVIDKWRYQREKTYQVVQKMDAGYHDIRMEYYEGWGQAAAHLNWEKVASCEDAKLGQACGTFFNSQDLSGAIAEIKISDNIDFDWGTGSPSEQVQSNRFSARWISTDHFEQGVYRFQTDVDDGVRIYVDNKMVLDLWKYQWPSRGKQALQIPLSEGKHTIKVEYHENWGYAKAKVSWEKMLSCDATPAGKLCAEYFNNRELKGTPVDVQYVDAVDFDWQREAPTRHVAKNKFSVRWTGNVDFTDGLYRFRTEDVDDGLRIFVDDESVLDVWKRKWSWYGNQRALKNMTAGQHKVVVEYREDWGKAVAKAFWEKAPNCETEVPTGEFCASYYQGIALEKGKRLDTKIEKAINHAWGSQSPSENIPRDKFSVRWVGDFKLDAGEYTFNVLTDDGFRLKIDDKIVIESWKGQAPTPYQKRVFLTAGTHRMVAEYYEAWGGATAKLNWIANQLHKPAAPSNLIITANSQDQVSLAWNKQDLASSYKIYRDGVLLATVVNPEFHDNNVQVNQNYRYQITAVWPTGQESDSAEIQVSVADTIAPSQATQLKVNSTTPTSISFAWNASTDNVAVAKYEILRDQVIIAEVTETNYNDSQLSSFKQYNYQIIAIDSSGNRSIVSKPFIVVTQDGTAPSAPSGLNAVLNDHGQVVLSWQAATDNIGVNAYHVFRNDELIGTSNNTHYIDDTVSENTSYHYHIVAFDSAGNASDTSESFNITSGDHTPPTTVTNLRADIADDYVQLSWDEATDNVAVVNYKIFRDDRAIALTKLNTYKDTSVNNGMSYRYTVKAIDAGANTSPMSKPIEITMGAVCKKTSDYFVNTVEPSLIHCRSCHIAGGQAQNTRFIMNQAIDTSKQNLAALTYISQLIGSNTVLNKISGSQSHGGGTIFSPSSAEYTQLAELLSQLDNPQACDVDTEDPEPSDEPRIPVASLVGNCASCHGTEGASSGPATPSIAGLESQYLLNVMRDYQSGKRASTVMNRIMTGYTETQLHAIADYFSQQPHHVEAQVVDASLAAQGKLLHENHCASCHSDNGRNANLTGTRLAGQWKVYMRKTLQDYLAGSSSAPDKMLQNLHTIKQVEGSAGIEALVEFYASIQPDTQAPTTPDAVELAASTVDSITLSWIEPDDNWSVSYYEIYRDGVLIAITDYSVFTDTNLPVGDYEYHIIAIDSAGNRSKPSEVLAVSLSSDTIAPDGARLLSYASTLRKASLLLLGRDATEAELATTTSEASYKATLRKMLDDKHALDKFVYRTAHETFLTEGAAGAGSGQGIREEDYPALETLSKDERRIVNNSIKKEPVFLLQYIVDNDKPWTQALTADYTVLNAALAKALGANPLSGKFGDTLDTETKLPSKITTLSARLGDKAFPHAGVLTTNAWLSRFPTTDTNRNRHRASTVYKQFLGINIEALAQRPIDDSENGDFLVPTLENPNCMVCHTVMDPVAGAFKNWGTNNRYQQNHNGTKGDFNSLSRSYRSRNYGLNYQGEPWYHSGDAWYRDMLKPGFADQEIPDGFKNTTGDQDSLQWLANAIVSDPRFAKGSVYFWYRGLFKRKPLVAPLDTSELNYANRLAAYNEQDAILEQLKNKLVQNQGNGAWNIKDLLVNMTATPLFRTFAQNGDLTATSDLGVARLLTPEELNHKLKALTGSDWWHFRDDRVWRDRMGTFYGDFDGGKLQTTPSSKINSLMSKIPERMAIEMSCTIVHDEFRKDAAERNLFRFVDMKDTPALEQIDTAKNNILVNPGAENDMQGWILETGSVRILSGSRGCDGGPSIKSGEKIFNPGSICENTTALGRIYQQVDVTAWADLIDQGGVQALYGAALRGWSRDNDEASVYLSFHHANGEQISASEPLLGGSSEWKSVYDYINIPIQTRIIRYHIQGRRISEHRNNDSFADDTYLRIVLPGTYAPTLGEQKIRTNIQFLHQHLLDESVAIDSAEVDRTYHLFKDVWADNKNNGETSCRLYRDNEDPDKTKRAWSIVLMYLLTDARFLYE